MGISGVLRRLKFGVPVLLAMGIAAGQPVVTAVANSASGIVQGLPNAGIAQGSIFLVVGTGLGPSTLTTATNAFQTTTVGGTSVSIVVNNTTVNAPLYYVSATQIAALLPSNTPVGTGALTVTSSSGTSVSTAVGIVQSNFGIFTALQNGTGPGIVTYGDYSVVSAVPGRGSLGGGGPYTYGGAANQGDTLVLWGTGLGPVSGNELSGAGLGAGVSNPSLTLLIGGVPANVSYQGRSGCCIGEDQIIFTIPAGVPTGCAVPLAVQIGTEISNYASIPIATSGRSCTPQDSVFAGAAAKSLVTGSAPFNYASFQLGRRIGAATSSGVTFQDFGLGQFAQVSVSPTAQPTILSMLDTPPLGTCTAFSSQSASPSLLTVLTGIDAGAITVSGPNGQVAMKEQKSSSAGFTTNYSAIFSQNGTYFSGGAYKIAAAGGADVGSFATSFTITQTPSWPSSEQASLFPTVARAKGMTINWNGGSAAYSVEIDGSATTSNGDGTAAVSSSFSCFVPSTAGTFTVPASVLLTLPTAPNGGEIDFKPTLAPVGFSATGLDIGILSFQYQTSFFVPFN